jgi:hypothetical protein
MDEQDHLEGAQPLSQDREQEPQGLVPPYEGRQTQAKEGLDEHMDKVFDRVDEVPPGPGREVSDEEREGVPATDTEATSPLGVGESMSRRGDAGCAGRRVRVSQSPGARYGGLATRRCPGATIGAALVGAAPGSGDLSAARNAGRQGRAR